MDIPWSTHAASQWKVCQIQRCKWIEKQTLYNCIYYYLCFSFLVAIRDHDRVLCGIRNHCQSRWTPRETWMKKQLFVLHNSHTQTHGNWDHTTTPQQRERKRGNRAVKCSCSRPSAVLPGQGTIFSNGFNSRSPVKVRPKDKTNDFLNLLHCV